jgi:PEP-CTERM motif-containing protein
MAKLLSAVALLLLIAFTGHGATFARSVPSGAARVGIEATQDRQSKTPEPATMFLMGSGLLVLGSWARREISLRWRM